MMLLAQFSIWYEDSNDFCKAWEEITDYFDKAMTTKLRRIRLQGYFTTVRFHNVMHEWKGTWVGFIAHVIEQICQYQKLCKFESDKYNDTQLITFMDAIFCRLKALAKCLSRTSRPTRQLERTPGSALMNLLSSLLSVPRYMMQPIRRLGCRLMEPAGMASGLPLMSTSMTLAIMTMKSQIPMNQMKHNMYTLINDVMSLAD
jgi:hypothetical protein